ncbi:MAG: uroporphyrinogen decarboxylase family protein [Armatimonadota bacterium]
MTDRERFIQTMLFGTPDRIPYHFGWPRQSTLEAWYLQGLPRGIDFADFVGMDRMESLPVNLGPVPPFEPVVLEETDRHKVWIDELGAKRLDHKVPPTPGFVTRKWLEFPVKTRDDFRRMIERYNPHSPERYPSDWNERKKRYRGRDFVLMLAFPSMFWRVRDWVGLERLCMLMIDDPNFVHEMMEYVADFTVAVLDRALREVDLDWVYFNEDMAYKTKSMISPKMVKEFLWPRYRKLVRFFRERGVSVLVMDCDGYIGELIPFWLDVGINAVGPVEIAAGNDPVLYRKQYGRNLAMMGGIDKRELRFGKEEVRREVMSKVPWLVEQGGYIPAVDHGVPPDVPLRNYLYMCELIKEIACGGRYDLFEPPGLLEAQLGPIQEMWSPEKAWTVPDE